MDAEKELLTIDTPMFNDRFERIEDDEGLFAVDNRGELTLHIPVIPGVATQIFKRRIVKPFVQDGNKTLLIGQVDNVFLYIDDDGLMIMTTDGEMR